MANEGGEAYLANAKILACIAADGTQGNGALRHAQIQKEQNAKADQLRNCRCHSRAKNAEIAYTNQKKVAKNVQNTARGQADHCIKRLALIAQIVVEHQGADHNGAGGQDPKAVVTRIRQNGLGAAQKAEQGIEA